MTNEQARADMIDWNLAVVTARRLTRPGPKVTVTEAREVVDDIRRFADAAEAPVREFTGLDGTVGEAPVMVVDRGGWVQANADGMRQLISPLVHKLRGERPETGLMDQVGPKLTGLETGALLAFLSGKVLGQFDPFWSDGDGRLGRLLLVAPNVVHIERELRVEPRDFRMWVCLHEETHRVQFTAVPWLRDYLQKQIGEFVDATDTDASALLARMREVLRTVLRREPGEEPRSVLDLVQSPEQRAVIDRVTAVMSLLEGHAEVVMDDVGPEVVPSVENIRKKFQRRRTSAKGLDRAARRFLGLDAKLRQYRDGAKFVRAVIDDVGMAGFNRVWDSAETLPSLDEITDPVAWVRRQGGKPALSP